MPTATAPGLTHPSDTAPSLPPGAALEEATRGLQSILKRRALRAMFQPILDMNAETYIGFEGLIRGPDDSPLHAPADLFCAARQCGLVLETEMLCRQVVLEAFADLRLPGRLFLNVSPGVLVHPGFRNGQTLAYMEYLGIRPDRVTIEITEHEICPDMDAMREALLHYRRMGFKIALDDLGEGFASLRLWSELHPEFVKIDRHFVTDVGSDPLKRQFLKSFQQIAEGSGCQIIAEGIESEAEFLTIKGLGIALGQGYLIGRPAVTPALVPDARALPAPRRTPPAAQQHTRRLTAHTLLMHVEPASPETSNNDIYLRFSEDPALNSIAIVKHGRPLGLINRHAFMERFAQPFQRELLGAKACSLSAPGTPPLVEHGTPLPEIALSLGGPHGQRFSDDFVITDKGYYLGIGSWFELLRAITHMQLEAARHANPLTLLPGNVPVSERIRELLDRNARFHICYCDLDNFKPFNDTYGYFRGDEMLRLTGSILSGACDTALDFAGHIGGDDFILLMQSADWEQRCRGALGEFARTSATLTDELHHDSEDEAGAMRPIFSVLPNLSIGACRIEPGMFSSPVQVADAARAARKVAKRIPGNSLFLAESGLPVHRL
jgi:diguanylate cyclase (GGDEF)-like protein